MVATPIGNLQDMTLRALEILKKVDVIAAEDTRHSATLLSHFGIHTKLTALHEHNERSAGEKLIAQMQEAERSGDKGLIENLTNQIQKINEEEA